MRIVDEVAGAVGWLDDGDRMRRTSHALGDGGRVWLVDVIDHPALDERIDALGRAVGVLQLLDRHDRDCAAVAERLGVPLHVAPRSIPDSPFTFLPVLRTRFWTEVALWWPDRRVLVCADALGTIPFFRAGAEPVGVHPFLRPIPPRRLRGLEPEHLLVGHGEGLHGVGAARAVDDAIAMARRRIPRWLAGVPRIVRSG